MEKEERKKEEEKELTSRTSKKEKEEKIRKGKHKKIIVLITSIILGIFVIFGLLSFFVFPKITLNGKSKVTVEYMDEYKEEGATAKEFISHDISKSIVTTGEVDTTKVGTYKITYKVRRYKLTFTKVREVKVVDTKEPEITLKGDTKLTLCPGSDFKETGVSAKDNYDGDLTDKIKTEVKETEVIYTVTDSSGNTATVKRELNFEDKQKPTIKLKGSSTLYLTLNAKYTESGFDATDNCDGNITDKVKTTNNINTAKVGDYKVDYVVEDKTGNKTTVTRKVLVRKEVSPNSNASSEPGVIYLTFDDGPSASITPKLLDLLKSKGVKATFFVINHDSSLDYLIKREHNEGHTVALHSYTHNYSKVYASVNAFWNEFNAISDKVYKLTGFRSKFIRFPGGSSNTVSRHYSKGIMTTLTKDVVNKGYKYFDWNVGSGDAGDVSTKEGVYRNVINGLSKKRINMVLMHDYENNYKTLNAISDIIDYGKKNNYEFRAITESTPMVTHGVNN